ncbi:hypothetical protein IMSHALPRED_000306 [Imshaugia aleurites]|uniref:Uncharacterized protein n=1 Tax=Imshaugia aleurites TaxID=172621 RepID=A0A8H3EU71_9LECA|nr:hypothetical protein IMSHALPRED_000306 [Imshaugia aleurites]
MPTVGKELAELHLCICHQGSIVPFLSSVYLLRDTNTAIVVLTNSMANNDAADWLGQLLLEAVLDKLEKNDYVSIPKASAKTSVGLWPRMARELETHRSPNTQHKSLVEYVGIYYNNIDSWCIEVFEDIGELRMCFQRNRELPCWLDHYQHDVSSWLLTRKEDAHLRRFSVINAELYLIDFKSGDAGTNVDQLVWRHDPDVPGGEIFYGNPLACGSMGEVYLRIGRYAIEDPSCYACRTIMMCAATSSARVLAWSYRDAEHYIKKPASRFLGGYFITIAPDCLFDTSGSAGICWRSRSITLSTESWLLQEKSCEEHFLLLIN